MNPTPWFAFAFLSVGAASLFGFLAVASWADARRQERESYYKNDMLKKLGESDTAGAAAALEYLREEKRIATERAAAKKREGYVMGGLVNVAVGIALTFFLKALVPGLPIYLVGPIQIAIGVALLAYVYIFGPKQ